MQSVCEKCERDKGQGELRHTYLYRVHTWVTLHLPIFSREVMMEEGGKGARSSRYLEKCQLCVCLSCNLLARARTQYLRWRARTCRNQSRSMSSYRLHLLRSAHCTLHRPTQYIDESQRNSHTGQHQARSSTGAGNPAQGRVLPLHFFFWGRQESRS